MKAFGATLLACLAAAAAAQQDEAPSVLGRSSAAHLQFEPIEERVDLAAGSRLRLQPELSSPLLEVLAAALSVPVLDRSGDWIRVRVGSWQGWVLATGVDSGPLTSMGLAQRGAAVPLELAYGILGERLREGTLAPYRLLTDVAAEDLLARLGRVVDNVPKAYRERFGIDPGSAGDEIIILFAAEEDYRLFEAKNPSLVGLETEGHTTQVIAETTRGTRISTMTATFVGDRPDAVVEEVLVHELTHLLSRRAWGTRIPAWLEEGMAEDLALSHIDSEGRVELGSWGGTSGVRSYFLAGGSGGLVRRRSGSREALFSVLATWHEPTRTDLETLTLLPWGALVDPGRRGSLYAQSALLVRFLLGGTDTALTDRFLSHLSALASGSADMDLWHALEHSPAEVEEALYLWLRQRAVGLGMRLP